MTAPRLELTLGPLLFNWPAQRVRDFYARIADEAAVERVYLGEVVCGKRAPLLDAALAEAADRLERAGKAVVWSTLALPSTPRERRATRDLIDGAAVVEINDMSGLAHLGPETRFVAGPLLNIYNEAAAGELMAQGCARLCTNVELPLASIAAIAKGCEGLEIEVFVYGRLPLALATRCYHARAHGLHKDNCQFVCDRDPDGMAANTLEGAPLLAVNGIQTLSHGVQVVDTAPETLMAVGVSALRLSPHSGDMVAVAEAFRCFADGETTPQELRDAVAASGTPGELVNGYLDGAPGIRGSLC